MRWRGRRQSRNVDDLRSGGGGRTRRAGGGLRLPLGGRKGGIGGIGTIIVVLVAVFVFDVDPRSLLEGGDLNLSAPEPASQPGQRRQGSSPSDEMGQFAATILGDTETTWNLIFSSSSQRYAEPRLVLFSGQVSSACGYASAATGPFYCPGDSQLYIDLSFFKELSSRFEAPGDFAQAYVIAHEVGHHVQNLMGILPRFHQMRDQLSKVDYNALSVRIELQADCFAGIWGHYANEEQDYLEKGDIAEALNAAAQIGDDTLQRRSQGYVVPESFNHGASDQRARWFQIGLRAGKVAACDTLNAEQL